MACRAFGGYSFLFVTPNAKRHFYWDMRLRKRKGHIINVAVTILAGDFSERDVPSVGEIGMVGDSMNLDPRDLLIFLDVTNQLFFFFALRHCLFMTVLAKLDIGNGSFLMGKYLGVTVKTIQSCFFYMLLVIICNGLSKACRIRTTDDRGKKHSEDPKQFPMFHRISMEIGGGPFLSDGALPRLQGYQKI